MRAIGTYWFEGTQSCVWFSVRDYRAKLELWLHIISVILVKWRLWVQKLQHLWSSSSYLHDWAIVGSGAEIGLLSLRRASLGDFLLAPVCPAEKVPLWGLPLFNVGIRNHWGCRERKFLPELGIEPGAPGPKPSTLSTRLSLHLWYQGSNPDLGL